MFSIDHDRIVIKTFKSIVWLFLLIAMLNMSRSALANDALKVVISSKDPPSISPFHAAGPDAFTIINAIYDSMIYVGENGEIQYNLVESYKKVSPTKHEFILRKGIKFHNGEDLTAESVKATFDMHLSPIVKSTRQYVYSSIKSVHVKDRYIVLFETKYPDSFFIYRFALFSGIAPASLIKKYGPNHLDKIRVGVGPFKFSSWEKGKRIVLQKNQNYWQNGLPKSQALEFLFIPKDEWKLALLENKADIVTNFPGKEARLLAPTKDIKIIKQNILASYWFLLNNRQGPLANPLVRRAINLAVNRDDLIQYVAYGNGSKMGSMGMPGEFGAEKSQYDYPYNVEEAKELLSRAGYPDGIVLKGWVTEMNETVAKILKKQLSLAGIGLDYEILSRTEYSKKFELAKLKNNQVPEGLDFAINLVPNPFGNLGFHILCLLYSNGIQSISSYPELDKMYEDFVKSENEIIAKQKLETIDEYIHKESLFIPTYQLKMIVASRSNVTTEVPSDGTVIGKFITHSFKVE
jgi:peptide/nickel transport system substrate-binding protein